MPCSVTLSTYSLGNCFSNKGGIKTIYIANYVENAVSATTSGETISSFVSGITWYKQELRRGTGSMTSSYAYDDGNGSSLWTTEAVIEYTKMQKENRLIANALAIGDIMMVVVDNNGEAYFLGEELPVRCNTGTGETGSALSDKNAFSMTATDECSHSPRMLDDSALQQVMGE